MRISLKHFALGAALASLPMSFYGYIRLKPQTQYQPQVIENKMGATNNEVVQETLNSQFTIYHKINSEPETQFLAYNLLNENINSKDKASQTSSTPTPTRKPTPFSEPTSNSVLNSKTASYVIHTPQAPEQILAFIDRYSIEYGVNKDMMIHIARCESGFRENAVNGPYAGIYQFVSSTWSSNRNAMGLDPNPGLRFNAEESVKTAAFKMSRDGFSAWPVCSNKAKNLISQQ